MRIALFQPDIAGNVGTIIRTAACFGVGIDIIEPCGFPLGARDLRRAAMDYAADADVVRHIDWEAFRMARPARIALFTTRANRTLHEACFDADDTLLFGSESSGAPAHVHQAAGMAVRIPIMPGTRSLNVAVSAGIALGEALRQTRLFPK